MKCGVMKRAVATLKGLNFNWLQSPSTLSGFSLRLKLPIPPIAWGAIHLNPFGIFLK
jgi:hypothetical protein